MSDKKEKGKKDKNFLSAGSWNPIRIRKSSQGSKSGSETQRENKANELKKSTQSIDTAVNDNYSEDSESRKPSFLARQLRKLKFGGKSNQVGDASDETNLSKGITVSDVEKQKAKSNETQFLIDQPGFNDFIGQSSTYPPVNVLRINKRVRGPHNRHRKTDKDVEKTDFNDIEHLL